MKRLVILAPNWLGDAVMALPAIADVRRASPGASATSGAAPSQPAVLKMRAAASRAVSGTTMRGSIDPLGKPSASTRC